MVLAVAALVAHLYAAPSPLPMPSTSLQGPEADAAPAAVTADGTKPSASKPAATKSASDESPASNGSADAPNESSASNSQTTHFNFDHVALNDGSASGRSSATLTAVSLTDAQKQGLSTVRIPDAESTRPVPIPAIKTMPSRRDWIVLAVFEHSAGAFDAYTTRQAIGRGAVEEDPMMRPFAHSPAIYAAIQVGPVLCDLLARRMQRSENPMFRRLWWMPQSISTAAFLSSGIHNTGVRGRP
jgi:hypothetical protein